MKTRGPKVAALKLDLVGSSNPTTDEGKLILLAKENPQSFMDLIGPALQVISERPINPIPEIDDESPLEESGWTYLPVVYDRVYEELNWIWEDQLIEGGLSIIAADPKCGKSTFVRNLIVKVARGEEFLERYCKRRGVIYVSLEDITRIVVDSLKRLGATVEDSIWIWDKTEGWLERVTEKALEVKPGLIVVDTLGKAFLGRHLNEYEEMQECFLMLQKLARFTKAHVLCVHHTNKDRFSSGGGSILGSQAIRGATDANFTITKESSGRRVLSSEQRYGKDLFKLGLKFDEATQRISKEQFNFATQY